MVRPISFTYPGRVEKLWGAILQPQVISAARGFPDLRSRTGRAEGRLLPAAAAASAALLLFLASVSFTHSYDFSNRLAFWERAAQDSPANYTANFCLADAYAANLAYDQAARYYRKALRIDPAAPYIHHNLSLIYYKRGQAGLAEKEFKKELDTNPAYREFTGNLNLKEEIE